MCVYHAIDSAFLENNLRVPALLALQFPRIGLFLSDEQPINLCNPLHSVSRLLLEYV